MSPYVPEVFPPMEAIGGITITPLVPADGETLRLTTDPTTYDPYDWPQRSTSHAVIGGRRVRQCAGKFAADCTVTIETGAQWLNKGDVQTLMLWHARPCATFTVADYEGNVYSARIVECHPVKAPGLPDLYELSMTLEVIAFSELLGQPYTGA